MCAADAATELDARNRSTQRPHARSSWAYFSTSFFNPNLGNCTVILALSPSPSRRYTTPSPYLGWRTRWPGRSAGRLALASGVSAELLVSENFLPREAKNSAMLSIELYLGPEYPPRRMLLRARMAWRPARSVSALWSSSS